MFYKWMGDRRVGSEPGDEIEATGGRAGGKPAAAHSRLSPNVLGRPLSKSCLAGWVSSCRCSFSPPLPWGFSSFSWLCIFILQQAGLWLLPEDGQWGGGRAERLPEAARGCPSAFSHGASFAFSSCLNPLSGPF